MGKNLFVGLWCAIILSTGAHAQTGPDPNARLVDTLLSLTKTNLPAFLDEFSKQDVKTYWPQIKPVSTIENMPAGTQKEIERKWHELASKVFDELLAYSTSLPPLDSNKCFRPVQTLNSLITFRNVLIGKMSYANLLLADTVNAIVFMELTRRIQYEHKTTPEVNAIARSLQDYALDLNRLEQISLEFSNRTAEDLRQIELPVFTRNKLRPALNPSEDAETRIRRFYRILIMTAGGGTMQDVLVKAPSVARQQLLRTEDMFSLLRYYEITDAKIYRELPLLLEGFTENSRQDGESLISPSRHEELGTSITWPSGYRAGVVERLAYLSMAGELDKSMGFGIIQKALCENVANNEIASIQKTLEDIESVKAQLRLLKNLDVGADITREDIESYLRRKLETPAHGGKYVVGKIGEDAEYISGDGKVIKRAKPIF